MTTVEVKSVGKQLADYVINNLINKTKDKFININEVSEFLKKKLDDEYTGELGMAVREALINHEKLDYFLEGTYLMNDKFHYSTGRWLALKGMYTSPLGAKFARGWYSWQDSEEVDWDSLD